MTNLLEWAPSLSFEKEWKRGKRNISTGISNGYNRPSFLEDFKGSSNWKQKRPRPASKRQCLKSVKEARKRAERGARGKEEKKKKKKRTRWQRYMGGRGGPSMGHGRRVYRKLFKLKADLERRKRTTKTIIRNSV